MSNWRLAQSLQILLNQVDAKFPGRDRRTDGSLSGYPGSHSSHNINSAGVVCAQDITTGDYAGGISTRDGMALAEAIRKEIKIAPRGLYAYVIHHMEPPYVPYAGPWIAHGDVQWEWVPYTGPDGHTSHIHVSVDWDIYTGGAPSGECPYDMTDPWNLEGTTSVTAPAATTITPIAKDWFDMASKQDLQDAIYAEKVSARYKTADAQNLWNIAGGVRDGKQVSMWRDAVDTNTLVRALTAQVAALTATVNQLAAKQGTTIDYTKIQAATSAALSSGIKVSGTITAGGK